MLYKKSIKRVNAFTLLELTLSVCIIGLLLPSMFSLYNFIIKSNREIVARQNTIQQWYEFFERLNILMQDYTVDYEEYYNRQMVWCTSSSDNARWSSFTRDTWKDWYCSEFTAYWNRSSFNDVDSLDHNIYYCSSERMVNWIWTKVVKGNGQNGCGRNGNKQSYGQYAALFKDVKGWTGIIVGSEDDEELWRIFNSSVNAIADANNIQEIYLISHNWKNRLYFRRKLVREDWNFTQYKIQMLRLRWFDAWRKHNFSITDKSNEWLYDWVIDTWACDTSMWFIWSWDSVGWAYSEYHLPFDVEDCWIDLTYGSTNIYSWNISISPLWDSDLFWAAPEHQWNTYMKIMTVNWVYIPTFFWSWRTASSIKDFKVPLETTINMKDFYRWYSD